MLGFIAGKTVDQALTIERWLEYVKLNRQLCNGDIPVSQGRNLTMKQSIAMRIKSLPARIADTDKSILHTLP